MSATIPVSPEPDESLNQRNAAEHLPFRNGHASSQSMQPVPSASELEKLDEQELKAAIKDVWEKHQRLTGKELGPLLYWLRLRLRAQGSRNDIHEDRGFGAWVESTLDVARSTAARWADDYAKELTARGLTSTQIGGSYDPNDKPKPDKPKPIRRSKGISLWVTQPRHKQYKQALEKIKEHFKIADSGEAVVKGLCYAAETIAARSRTGNRSSRTTAKRG
jgi:hypothetical protein